MRVILQSYLQIKFIITLIEVTGEVVTFHVFLFGSLEAQQTKRTRVGTIRKYNPANVADRTYGTGIGDLVDVKDYTNLVEISTRDRTVWDTVAICRALSADRKTMYQVAVKPDRLKQVATVRSKYAAQLR